MPSVGDQSAARRGASPAKPSEISMTILAICLAVIGALIVFVSSIWFLVVAFQRHVLWGIAVLLLPFTNLVFLAVGWAQAKRPFVVSLAGVALCIAGVFA